MTGRGYRGPLGLRLTLRMAPEELFRFTLISRCFPPPYLVPPRRYAPLEQGSKVRE